MGCVNTDFRAINYVTLREHYSMERVRGTVEWLSSKKIFTIVDLKYDFYQVRLDEA